MVRTMQKMEYRHGSASYIRGIGGGRSGWGRLHVPQEYLEQLNIRGRARLEVTEDGILIRRSERQGNEKSIPNKPTLSQSEETKAPTGGLLNRLGLRKKN